MVPSLRPSEPSGKPTLFHFSVATHPILTMIALCRRYRSEDEEEEEEDDDDGSSVEEEDEEEHVEEHHHQQGSALGSNSNPALDLAPAYTQPTAGSGVQTGSNGYAVSC